MKCNEIREQFPDLAAGLVAGQPDVNEHLRSCAECAGTFAEFQKTMALLDEWQAPEPSAYFDTRLQARLREEMAKRPSPMFGWLRRPALAAGLAAIVAVGAVVLRLEEPRAHKINPIAAVTAP